ncbi:hypothetical protein HAX54_031192, partial [Datura stramonium]|nr:hypothetical protein [Datura stramonium]
MKCKLSHTRSTLICGHESLHFTKSITEDVKKVVIDPGPSWDFQTKGIKFDYPKASSSPSIFDVASSLLTPTHIESSSHTLAVPSSSPIIDTPPLPSIPPPTSQTSTSPSPTLPTFSTTHGQSTPPTVVPLRKSNRDLHPPKHLEYYICSSVIMI